MAVSVMTMLPPILVFFFAQKYFIQGIVFTGLKG
jgi:ABC-type glycerol-3-phosphate transport system permease component